MIRLPSNLAALRPLWRAAEGFDARSTPCFRMEAAGRSAKLYVYDVIGGWDNDSGEFVKAVHALDVDTIDLHINSPGGLVYDAVAMYEALEQSPAAVHAHVDGLAASAASFLAMVGDQRDISRGGRMMIHDAQIVAWGSPADLREAADLGDAVSDDIAAYYAAAAGGKASGWRAAMTATTTYSAAQAVDAGLMQRVSSTASDDDGPDNRSQLLRARHRALVTAKG
jgi:ATP-dependent protease ClpP protease subunit